MKRKGQRNKPRVAASFAFRLDWFGTAGGMGSTL